MGFVCAFIWALFGKYCCPSPFPYFHFSQKKVIFSELFFFSFHSSFTKVNTFIYSLDSFLPWGTVDFNFLIVKNGAISSSVCWLAKVCLGSL
jgi:hypothetical protein